MWDEAPLFSAKPDIINQNSYYLCELLEQTLESEVDSIYHDYVCAEQQLP